MSTTKERKNAILYLGGVSFKELVDLLKNMNLSFEYYAPFLEHNEISAEAKHKHHICNVDKFKTLKSESRSCSINNILEVLEQELQQETKRRKEAEKELKENLEQKDDLLREAVNLISKNGFNPLNGDKAEIANSNFLNKPEIQAIINKEKK